MVRGGGRLEKMGRSYIVIEHGKIRGNGGGNLFIAIYIIIVYLAKASMCWQ